MVARGVYGVEIENDRFAVPKESLRSPGSDFRSLVMRFSAPPKPHPNLISSDVDYPETLRENSRNVGFAGADHADKGDDIFRQFSGGHAFILPRRPKKKGGIASLLFGSTALVSRIAVLANCARRVLGDGQRARLENFRAWKDTVASIISCYPKVKQGGIEKG